MKRLSRRALLRGAGGVALGLPFLDAMVRPGRSFAQPGTVPRRVVFWFTSCGPRPETWWPTGGERDFTLASSMAPLAPFRDQLIVLDGVSMKTAIHNSGGRNGHDIGTGHCMVARPIQPGPMGFGEFGHAWDGSAGGISIDQHIAASIATGENAAPYDSLEFGVHATGIRQAVPSRISYRAAFEPVIPMNSPAAAFDRVFAPLAEGEDARARRRRRRDLVLGAVRSDLGRLRPRLGTEDRTRLDAHIASVGEIAGRLDGFDGSSCEAPARGDVEDYVGVGELQIDMLVAALKCDLTRVASIQWRNGQSGTRHDWLGHRDAHHSLSHRGASDEEARQQISEIDRWHCEQFARLLAGLQAFEVGDGTTLLDATTVVWVNEQEQGIGNVHRFARMPYVLAGSGGGAFRTGRFVDAGDRGHGDLFVSLMNMMGVPGTTFGDPDHCTGPIDALG